MRRRRGCGKSPHLFCSNKAITLHLLIEPRSAKTSRSEEKWGGMTKQLNMALIFSLRLPCVSVNVRPFLLDPLMYSLHLRQMKTPLFYRNSAISCFISLYFYGYILLSLTRIFCWALKKKKRNNWDFWCCVKRKASASFSRDRNHLNKGSQWLGWWPRGPVKVTQGSQTLNSHTSGKRYPEKYEVMWTVQYIRKMIQSLIIIRNHCFQKLHVLQLNRELW